MSDRPARLISLSNVYDQHYHDLRAEPIDRCLSWAKRRDLFRCLEVASGRELVVLSSPPKASDRRSFRWLSPVETRFSTHRQLFCRNLDGPKLRIPFSWLYYALHVLRHARSGDVVIVDNYELIYIIAAWLVRIFRRVTFLLDYEDGKHLIDRSWARLVSGLAEIIGRPLFRGALLAHPSLGRRLPPSIPTELVPGFVAEPSQHPSLEQKQRNIVRFLYAGSLDAPRGLPLLLDALHNLPQTGWQLDITGGGPLREQVSAAARLPQWAGKVIYHGSLPASEFDLLTSRCDVGLNCQRSDDPISGATFPSKIFTYLSAGLLVISSKASDVDGICQKACLYYDQETAASLAASMSRVIGNLEQAKKQVDRTSIAQRFSIQGTADRLKRFLAQLSL